MLKPSFLSAKVLLRFASIVALGAATLMPARADIKIGFQVPLTGPAATDGKSIWIANEYVNRTCSYNTWLATNFRCGNTRTQLANWGTRISKIVP